MAGIQKELDTLVKIIVETVPTEQIYLFGSYAYGAPHKDSDQDIYIVMKGDAPMQELDAMDATHNRRTSDMDGQTSGVCLSSPPPPYTWTRGTPGAERLVFPQKVFLLKSASMRGMG
ncbi:MAG: DNA polymerase beta domain-containing protei [Treponematales bacterium]